MKYALIENGKIVEYPVFEGDIRTRFSNCSFGVNFIPPEGYVEVQDSPYPSVDYTKNVTEGDPIETENGFQVNWIVEDASETELAERLDGQWHFIRLERNVRLGRSDWTQLTDAPVDAEAWAIYRQELRDITSQLDPFNIEWPVQPQ